MNPLDCNDSRKRSVTADWRMKMLCEVCVCVDNVGVRGYKIPEDCETHPQVKYTVV